jgi:hypothetical protein
MVVVLDIIIHFLKASYFLPFNSRSYRTEKVITLYKIGISFGLSKSIIFTDNFGDRFAFLFAKRNYFIIIATIK